MSPCSYQSRASSIRVFTHAPNDGFRTYRTFLTMFMFRGSAYASWKNVIRRDTSLDLRVSDALANQVIGIDREPCPRVGMFPQYSVFGTAEFSVYERKINGIENCLEECLLCGYTRMYPGNPRIRKVPANGDLSKFIPHRLTTRLVPAKIGLHKFENADWDSKKRMLVPATEARLVIWTSRIFGPTKSFLASFPNAKLVYAGTTFTVFRSPAWSAHVSSAE